MRQDWPLKHLTDADHVSTEADVQSWSRGDAVLCLRRLCIAISWVCTADTSAQQNDLHERLGWRWRSKGPKCCPDRAPLHLPNLGLNVPNFDWVYPNFPDTLNFVLRKSWTMGAWTVVRCREQFRGRVWIRKRTLGAVGEG